jgi:hypothetical protein
MEQKHSKTPDFYIQFDDQYPIEKIPFAKLNLIGTWERRSGRVFIGRSDATKQDLEMWLSEECGVPAGMFEIIPEKDAVISERRS